MKKEAICLLKQEPEIERLNAEIDAEDERFEKEIEELRKIADQKMKFSKKRRDVICDKIVDILKQKDLLHEGYNPDGAEEQLAINSKEGVVYLFTYEKGDKEKQNVLQSLKDSLSKLFD